MIKHKTSDNPQEFDKIKETLVELRKREKAIIEKNRKQRAKIKQEKPAPIEIPEATKDFAVEKPTARSVTEEPLKPQRQKKLQQGKQGKKGNHPNRMKILMQY